jgi:tetratricopeptide (TPR) repeat protein
LTALGERGTSERRRFVLDEPLRLRSGVDLTRANLSYEEGLFAALVDGRRSGFEIATQLGKSPDEAARIIEVLEVKQVLKGPDPYEGMIFPLPLMQAASGVSEADRKKIIFHYEKLDSWNYYELMKLRRRDDAAEVQNRFRELSLVWHPDRWRHAEPLGPFQKMITAVFARLQLARDTLTDPKKREAYDAEHANFFVDEDDLAEMLKMQRRRERDEKREREKIARRKKKNPMRARLDRAREQYRIALAHEKAGEPLEALRAAQTAATFEPKNPEYQALRERLEAANIEHKIEPLMKGGRRAESMTRWDEAIEAFERIVSYKPDYGPALVRLAYNMLQGKRDAQEALRYAQKAASLLPDEAEAHYVLALCYQQLDSKKSAVRACERALEIKPNHVEAKKLLKKLRWGF